jgi:hypothetical protein
MSEIRRPTPADYLKALKEANWNRREAAALLKVSNFAMNKYIALLRAAGEHIPESPYMTNRKEYLTKQAEAAHGAAPEGFAVKGVSTLYDKDGEVRAQWVKTNAIAEEQARLLLEAMRAAAADLPRVPRIPPPGQRNEDLLVCYPMGDPHIGMYAWKAETGEDFDLDIAERNLVAAVRRLVKVAPAARTAILANLGDFFHADTVENRTARSGNALDVDTRWAKVLRIGVRIMRTLITAALQKHQFVHVVNCIGNHDEHTSQLLSVGLAAFYEDNPRVTFAEAPSKFHYHRHGSTLLGFTHGDTVKLDTLGGVMSADQSADWGVTRHRYWLTGHVHHRRVFELHGCTAESFRTLAARDAWHTGAGYRSGRDMYAIAYHRDHGEVMRHRLDIAMLEAA